MKYVIDYKPKAITQVNWYVSPDDQRLPIHVFDTQVEAIEFAKEHPEPKHPHDIIVPACIGWLHKGGDPMLEVSSTRSIIDCRRTTKLRKIKLEHGRIKYV
jgi:hypothetical protein